MQGKLRKMPARQHGQVQYHLQLDDDKIALNPLLGKPIKLKHTGRIFCIHCNRAIKKTYNQGYCYPCFIALAECDLCVLKPETCHYTAGTCREPAWGEAFCFQPHVVYLANSSGIKVGITRQGQIPTRWIDQGATQALPIFQVASRHISGLLEVAIAKHVSDKTNWQQMLKGEAETLDLLGQRDKLMAVCEGQINQVKGRFPAGAIQFLESASAVALTFPVVEYPKKIKSLCFTKTPEVGGILIGIKGQYLLLDSGVINIRKYTGFEIEFVSDC